MFSKSNVFHPVITLIGSSATIIYIGDIQIQNDLQYAWTPHETPDLIFDIDIFLFVICVTPSTSNVVRNAVFQILGVVLLPRV